MTHSKRILLIALTTVSLLLIVAYAREGRQFKATPLAIEIALSKPFYVPAAAADSGKVTSVVIRVPVASESDRQQDAVSAIKLEPKMEGDKVKVTVYALKGEADAEHIKTCRDWDKLQATTVGTYMASLDEEVSLAKLRDYGVSMGNEPLTFRVVPRRVLSPTPQEKQGGGGGGCDCGSCGGLICCPNGGYCLGCGSCGSVCCSG